MTISRSSTFVVSESQDPRLAAHEWKTRLKTAAETFESWLDEPSEFEADPSKYAKLASLSDADVDTDGDGDGDTDTDSDGDEDEGAANAILQYLKYASQLFDSLPTMDPARTGESPSEAATRTHEIALFIHCVLTGEGSVMAQGQSSQLDCDVVGDYAAWILLEDKRRVASLAITNSENGPDADVDKDPEVQGTDAEIDISALTIGHKYSRKDEERALSETHSAIDIVKQIAADSTLLSFATESRIDDTSDVGKEQNSNTTRLTVKQVTDAFTYLRVAVAESVIDKSRCFMSMHDSKDSKAHGEV